MTRKRNKTYKFIEKLIDKVTTSESNNMSFTCYGHLVELQSGTEDYVSVAIYNTDDRYKGEMADFDFDYMTKELHFVFSESKAQSVHLRLSITGGISVSYTTSLNTRTRTRRMSTTRRTRTPSQ